MFAKSLYTIEFQVSIGLEEVIVRPHLYGSIARVAHLYGGALPGSIERYIARSQQHTAHRGCSLAIFHNVKKKVKRFVFQVSLYLIGE
jgi:hypothetical protein